MPGLSTGAKTSVGYVGETTYGVIPSTPSLTQIPFASVNFNTSKEELVDTRIDGSRQVNDLRHGNKTVSGELSGEFSESDYDTFIESAMLNTFSAGSIVVGDTINSMTIEEAQLDIGKYRKFSGVVANTLSIDAPIDGNTTVTFGLVGKEEGYDLGSTNADTSLDADGYTEAAFNTPFTHVNGTMTDDSGTLVGIVQGISIELDNGYEPAFTWGTDVADCQVFKKANITGTLTAYYIDESLVNKFLQESSTSITFSLTDGINTYTFTMDNVKYTGAELAVSDDSTRLITLPFRALDAGANTMLKITKS